MKILHCSDIHLGRRPVGGMGAYSEKRFEDYFSAFEKIAKAAVKEKVDIFIVAGDLFDRKELIPQVVEKTELIFKILKDANIEVLVIEGNHDNVTPGKEDESWIVYLENRYLIKRLSYKMEDEGLKFTAFEKDDFYFWGAGYPGGMVNETLAELHRAIKEKGGKNHIIMVHTAIGNDSFLPGTVDKETIDLFKDNVFYIAGGHFHSYAAYPKDNPYFFIPGSPEYWDLAESQNGKGFIIVDTDSGEKKIYPSEKRRKLDLYLKTSATTEDEFKNGFNQWVLTLSIESGEDLITVSIEADSSVYIDGKWCEDILLSCGALKSVVKVKYMDKEGKTEVKNEIVTLTEAERQIISTWPLLNKSPELVSETLKSLKDSQRDKNEDLFFDNLNVMLDRVLQGENKIEDS